jgi:sugar phosphate isomerase/epimerase
MSRLKIAVRLEDFGLPCRRALQEAGRLGVTGVQFDAVGDLAPSALSQTGRREFLHLLRSHHLEVAAVGCPLRHGLDVADNQQPRIEHVAGVMSLSFDLGSRVVLVEAGQVPEDDESTPARRLREALGALARHGDRIGSRLALVTGLEAGEVLRKYLDTFDTGSLAADIDPAHLLIHGFSADEAVRALRDKIAHVQGRDARRGRASRSAQETALGHGDIDWLSFLATLEEVEYRSWITVARAGGDRRAADLAAGVAFLRRLVG